MKLLPHSMIPVKSTEVQTLSAGTLNDTKINYNSQQCSMDSLYKWLKKRSARSWWSQLGCSNLEDWKSDFVFLGNTEHGHEEIIHQNDLQTMHVNLSIIIQLIVTWCASWKKKEVEKAIIEVEKKKKVGKKVHLLEFEPATSGFQTSEL